ncbi:PEP-CTERM sorting domain-containing protein [Coraliomargarita sp. SDUM461003]|uniref:PEP-CTERM sorting domain-containing protein n=1 Tax=Thalassobacterium maritimum TaxID=3041265 RepID=A0ABU1AU93_9BACT|nr:PEP-CTERM sorting domain-containing protein [Coraliomargarita sp. SDUM461003]MDQ8207731.1 PEP-CTERM sorting domain-containing protein [Coraliomargarita sp. SDUM461003]
MKNIIIASLVLSAASASAQTFVAGWDFDGLAANATSSTANWGVQKNTANSFWSHSVAYFNNPGDFGEAEFGFTMAANDTSANNAFSNFMSELNIDTPGTSGFTAFDQNTGGAEQGFRSLTGDDTFTLNFSGAGYSDLTLYYAYRPDGGSWALETVDLSAFDNNANGVYTFTPTLEGDYDNFAITGTAVPEPSAFAAIFGAVALGVAATRRRK